MSQTRKQRRALKFGHMSPTRAHYQNPLNYGVRAYEWGGTVDYPETSLFARNVEADLRDAASEQRKNDADAIKDARIDAYLDRRDFKVDPWQYPRDHHFAILLAI